MTTAAASARRFRRLRWIAFGVPAVLLIAFHGALLAHRFADASIARPMVLGRWAFAIVLLSAAFMARRFFSGRRIVITFWLLVTVLHLTVPTADRVFDARENVALLIAVLPALIVVGAAAGTPASARWPASTLLFDAAIGFLPLRLDPFRSDRAPPSF